jgi:D-amino-acid dehydrogenase
VPGQRPGGAGYGESVKVVVIGSGVVGLCCAYELNRGGADVCVLERGRLSQGASRGNTGWVCPSFTYPLPAPGIIGEGLRGMLRGGGPLVIHPSLDPTFLRWLLGFRRSATRERWEHGVRALLALNARTLELFDVYADGGVRFEMHRSGLLLVATTSAGLTSYTTLFRRLRSIGFTGEIVELGPEEARALEPELAAGGLAGGVRAVIDRYVRPESLTDGLSSYLAEHDVEMREEIEVLDIAAANGGISITTGAGPVKADRVVVAAGATSSPLLARLGVRMPLVGARGYSVTLAGGDTRPSHALYLAEAKVGISSYDDTVRIAGVFELGSSSDRVDRRRLAAMLSTVEPYFEDWRPGSEPALLEWAGLRPMTADGLPLIGRAPALDNAYVATGHGMLGVTLAPASAAALAPLVLEGRSAPELLPFDPARAA